MSWIVDHTGRVAYKASWTDAKEIRAALAEVLEIRNAKAVGRTRAGVSTASSAGCGWRSRSRPRGRRDTWAA